MYSAKLIMFTSFFNFIIVINISIIIMILEKFRVTLTANGKCSDSSCEFVIKIEKRDKTA